MFWRLTLPREVSRSALRIGVGRVWMPPVLQEDFLIIFAVGTCIGRVSGLFRGVVYALAGMQFEEQSPHRFRELDARAPGLVYPILNIEVLAALLISRSPCRGLEAPRRSPLCLLWKTAGHAIR